MHRSKYGCRVVAGVLAACVAGAGCTHSDRSSGPGGGGRALSTGEVSAGQPQAVARSRPANPSDGYRLAEIAVQRLGGAQAPSSPHVTGVSVVDEYGLTVYDIGGTTQELLSIKERGKWRPLGTDAYYANGRGLIHFGLSPDLAGRLIAALRPPPSQ